MTQRFSKGFFKHPHVNDRLRRTCIKEVDLKVRSIMESVQGYRSLKKSDDDIERYLSLVGNDDRAHDSIDQLGTKTGRFSCVLHSVPKGPLRSFFKARPGYKLIIADFSQQEARIIAGLSKDPNAIELFKAGKDIYLEVAKAFVGDSGKNLADFRKVAKTIVLGLNYGRSEYSIHQELIGKGMQLSLDEVRSFTVSYYRMFEGVFKWRQASVAQARARKQVRTRDRQDNSYSR